MIIVGANLVFAHFNMMVVTKQGDHKDRPYGTLDEVVQAFKSLLPPSRAWVGTSFVAQLWCEGGNR